MECWYFAYGSNLCIHQLAARIGAMDRYQRAPRIVRLAGYRLTFGPTEVGGEWYANIVTPGDGVLGVVYWCDAEQLDRLDRHEDGYDRLPISVTDQAGEVLQAVAYAMRPFADAAPGKPTSVYLQSIVSGARRHGLPETYISQITALALASR
jgi:gamma-glutamylcyclotransferase (GGCT)/AIG2-like uncharacterized protein YtfP